ncbi:OmpA family protein [uncultured Formosa sp.]|uniref:OmpA family protein n=1 Tax=uncultured Formosa sp. TaxID=255435 RepID=UPI002638E32A|nr:OmpA family protein [uncultured Formosa sp.]
MDNHLLKPLSHYITPDLITQAADTLDESETSVFKAMSSSIPTLLTGLLNNITDTTFIDKIINLANHEELDASHILSDPTTLLTNKSNQFTLDAGTSTLNMLFDTKQSSLLDLLGNASGVKKPSVFRLLHMTAPMLLAFIKQSDFDTDLLIKTLLSEKDDILMATPVGLQALLSKESAVKPQVFTRTKKNKKKETEAIKHRWIIPFLIFVASILLFVIMKKSDGEPDTPIMPNKVPETLSEPIEPLVKDTKTDITLPNGYTFKASETGLENNLSAWLAQTDTIANKDQWFNFDKLLFPTAEAKLLPESNLQLKNLVEILNAYPNISIKIGGYTDNTGDANTNLKLSSDRAQNVVNELISMGIDPKRLSAEGYGNQHPVASNDTEIGRSKNRRIALRITSK